MSVGIYIFSLKSLSLFSLENIDKELYTLQNLFKIAQYLIIAQ